MRSRLTKRYHAAIGAASTSQAVQRSPLSCAACVHVESLSGGPCRGLLQWGLVSVAGRSAQEPQPGQGNWVSARATKPCALHRNRDGHSTAVRPLEVEWTCARRRVLVQGLPRKAPAGAEQLRASVQPVQPGISPDKRKNARLCPKSTRQSVCAASVGLGGRVSVVARCLALARSRWGGSGLEQAAAKGIDCVGQGRGWLPQRHRWFGWAAVPATVAVRGQRSRHAPVSGEPLPRPESALEWLPA